MPDFEAARRAVRDYAKAMDKTDAALGLADAIGSLAGAGDVFGYVTNGLSTLKALDPDSRSVMPNIHFVQNGLEDADSVLTAAYFRGRGFKLVGGAAVAAGGGIASGVTAGVNVGSGAKAVNAGGSTLVHLQVLQALAKNRAWEKSTTVQEWLNLCIAVKKHKLGVRGADLAGVHAFTAIPAALAAAFLKARVKLKYETIVMNTAAEIHWRAFQEQTFARSFGGPKVTGGPATAIFNEVFTKRGFTRLFGRYNAPALIREPAGWLPLADKLNMM